MTSICWKMYGNHTVANTVRAAAAITNSAPRPEAIFGSRLATAHRGFVFSSFKAFFPRPGWAMSFSISSISTGTKADMFS